MSKKQTPDYTVHIVSGSKKYNVTPAVVGFDRSEDDKQIAQSVILQLMDVTVGNRPLSDLLSVRNRVYINANDGTKKGEVFRGYLWKSTDKTSLTDCDLQFKCYDNLIYFQESDDSDFFSSGKTTETIMSSLCEKWGIKLDYSYSSIVHSKLVLRGKLADIFTADILDRVKECTGKKYVIRSEKDTMCVRRVGSNTTIYHFTAGENAIHTSRTCSMDGMVTKVVILGKADSEEREPVEATVKGNTSKYGTLQKIISRSENTSLEDAQREGLAIIDESGEPKWEYELRATDIPWIRKGDKVYVNAGRIKGYFIVTAVDRSTDNSKHEMNLTMEKA